MDDNFAQTLRRRLAETIAWCSTRPALATVPELLVATRRSDYERWQWGHGEVAEFLAPVLRTPELEPRGFEYPATETQRAEIVERLAEIRAGLLRDAGLYPTDLSGDLAGGRLLLYDPHGTDSSGGSWATSSGLFDVEDAPPGIAGSPSFTRNSSGHLSGHRGDLSGRLASSVGYRSLCWLSRKTASGAW